MSHHELVERETRRLRRRVARGAIPVLALAGSFLLGCSSDAPSPAATSGSSADDTAGTSAALPGAIPSESGSPVSPSPSIDAFALYAARTLRLGKADRVVGGAIGVASLAPEGKGPQLRVGEGSSVDPTQAIFAPSIQLDEGAHVGDAKTSSLANRGARLGARAPVPSAMPPIPLALASAPGTTDVTVAGAGFRELAPGSYRSLTVNGTLLLRPGSFSFSSVTVGEGARVLALPGGADVRVAGSVALGPSARLAPLEPEDGWEKAWGANPHCAHQPASQLALSILGSDADDGSTLAVKIASRAAIDGLVSAPHGTFTLEADATATGAFSAFDISVGDRALVTFDTGFAASGAGQHGSQRLSGYRALPGAGAPLASHVPATTPLTLAIGLPMQNAASLATLARNVSDPTSPLYRSYLTSDEIAAAYAPTVADYEELVRWVRSKGLDVVQELPNRTLIGVRGTAAAIEQALFVNLNYSLRPDGTRFYAPDREPSLDLRPSLQWISDLTSYHVTSPLQGSGPGGTLDWRDFRTAYTSCTSSLGEGQSIALFERCDYDPKNIAAYEQNTGLTGANAPTATITRIVPARQTQPTLDGAGNQRECEVDIETVLGLVPHLTNLLVFEGKPTRSSSARWSTRTRRGRRNRSASPGSSPAIKTFRAFCKCSKPRASQCSSAPATTAPRSSIRKASLRPTA